MKKQTLWKTVFFILFTLLLIFAWLGFGERGLLRLHRTEMERRALSEKIRRLAEENKALYEEVQRLRSDMKYLETVVREELNLIKENEVIYRFGKGKNSGDSTLPNAHYSPGKAEKKNHETGG